MKLTKWEICEILDTYGIPSINFRFADTYYQTISNSDVSKIWETWFYRLDKRLKEYRVKTEHNVTISEYLPKWMPEVFDCDNMSIGLLDVAQQANAIKAIETREKRGGLCLAMMWYKAEHKPWNRRSGGHSMLMCINGNKELSFFEPGDNKYYSLTLTERQSCWFGLFL